MNQLLRTSSAAPRRLTVDLTAECDVVPTDAGWIATSDEPWLRLKIDAAALAGRWIELIYDSGIADHLTRPLLRFLTPDDTKDEILPGAVLGRAVWLGKAPSRTTAILLSPTNRPGSFAFRVAAIRALSSHRLLERAWRGRPAYAAVGMACHVVGDPFLAERHFRRALHSTPVERYRVWSETRRRATDWSGFDALPPAARSGPQIRVVATSGEPTFLDHWIARLQGQPWPRWSLAAPIAEARPGVLAFDAEASLAACLADLAPDDLVLVADQDTDWVAEAPAIAGAAAMRDAADVYYGDEDWVGAAGGLRLKPDWSPFFARSADLIGKAWIARVGWARRAIGRRKAREAAETPLPVETGCRAVHLRRILGRRPAPLRAPAHDPSRPPAPTPRAQPCATIIIPTRDRADLLRTCLESLQNVGGRGDFEAVVVDNGSTDAATLAYLKELSRRPGFRVLARPGPFNFSALCNAAAQTARAAALVFLNNDTEALSPDWLDSLIAWTSQPSVGAVGAKLLFRNGTVQHAGVVVGIDGHAAHFERFRLAAKLDFFGRDNMPHEVSAVTGACLAIEKAKFDAVGGFDAVNLPVEFSDIDLCLRLAERGWGALMEPAAVLIHHEAASRKAWLSQEKRYATQVAYFKARWRKVLRDDPYFHPALSLDWHTAALG